MSDKYLKKQVKTLDETKRVPVRRKPFISEAIIDTDSQRYYLSALFALIQAWKLYDLYILHNNQSFDSTDGGTGFMAILGILNPKIIFVFKYFFFDSLLILIIPFLNIPKLSFTPSFSILLLMTLNTLTVVMTCSFSFSLSSILLAMYRSIVPEKELTIMEQYIDTESIINQSEHFKGKKTIRYAPNSSIKMNPFEEQFCVRPVYNDKIKIPIRVESTFDLQYLQINYQDFNNDNYMLNYTFKDLKNYVVTDYYNSQYAKLDPSVLADSNVKILEIPVDKPGYYSINTALDKKEKTIRSFRSNAVIPICPEAAFIPNRSFSADKCIDDTVDDMEIVLLGVPPFTLHYEEEIDGKLSHMPPTIVFNPEKVDSPLVQSSSRNSQNRKMKFAAQYLKDISWAKSSNVTIPLGEKQLRKSGKYIYTINKIVDGFGNVVNYTPHPDDKSIFMSFVSHPVPVLDLIDPSPAIPILDHKEKFLKVNIANFKQVQREGPYDVLFRYIPNSNETEGETFTRSYDLAKSSELLVRAEKPGTYIIEKGTSKFCPANMGSSSVTVSSAKPPKMEVALDSIVDNCVGTTGLKFNLEFVGTTPFQLNYKISKLDPNDSSKVLREESVSFLRSESTTLEYNFKPSAEGSYSIEFTGLNDRYYKNEIKFEPGQYRYVTYFKQKPKAYFNKHTKIQRFDCCNGASQNVTLNIEGKPPFDVTYQIIAPDFTTETYSIENVHNNKIDIESPKFTIGGDYTLMLKNVTDSSSCGVDFRGQEVHIVVRKEVPKLNIAKHGVAKIAQGTKFTIPLKAQSANKVDLIYAHQALGHEKEVFSSLKNHDPTQGITVSKAGSYRLVSFRSGKCEGEITEANKFELTYLPFPSLEVADVGEKLSELSAKVFERKMVCQNQADEINLLATGAAPFIVKYEVRHPNGRVEEQIEQINRSTFNIQMLTHAAGDYTYTIKEIFDATYTEEIIESLKKSREYKFDSLVFRHHVAALPTARFVENNQKIQTCVSVLDELKNLEPVNIQLEGALPLTLKVDIYHEAGGELETVEFKNIATSMVDLLSVYEYVGIGTHVITINQIEDANGCISDESKFSDQMITIQVYDVPKIRHLVEESNSISDFDSTRDGYYCVGDQIAYMLNGLPPFTIDYVFNSQYQQAEINGNYFRRRAPGPGELTIRSLSDSSSRGCMVDYTNFNRNDLKAIIYDLPSVEIVQGDHIEEDIHEGEQLEIIFKFTGTPPFKLTYIRKELDDSSKIVETEIIEDIMSHEHRILANLEGTYEAIEIQDKYCVARNHRI